MPTATTSGARCRLASRLRSSTQISLGRSPNVQMVVLLAFAPLVAASFLGACHLVHGTPPTRSGLPPGAAHLRAGAVSRAPDRPSGGRLAGALRACGPRVARRAARLPRLARARAAARHRRLRARARLARRDRDRRRRLRADPDRAAPLTGRKRTARRARARRPRPDAAPLPRRSAPLRRSGCEDRVPPSRKKEPSRCRSSSCSRH